MFEAETWLSFREKQLITPMHPYVNVLLGTSASGEYQTDTILKSTTIIICVIKGNGCMGW